MTVAEVCERLVQDGGGRFSPTTVEHFIELLGSNQAAVPSQ
jgi:hypothetical protein